MFEKLKQIKQLKNLHDALSQEKVAMENKGVKVVVNGKMEIEEIELNVELNKEDQEKDIKNCVNEAMKKVQMVAAQKMSQMGGLF